MVQHIVLLKWKPSVSAQQQAHIAEELLALPKRIPGITGYSAGAQCSAENLGKGFHFGFVMTFKDIQARVRSANVYFGSAPLLEALRGGAHIVISGRVADPSLVLAPLMHEFNWAADAWNLLASGTIAGHIIECGPQCSGGNSSFDWECIPQLSDVGYPIVEAESDGTFVVTKHDGTGGRVSIETIKEQLVYEIGDPGKYISPDVIADFTSIRLESAGENRVRVSPAKGKPRPEMLKTSVSYFDGYMSAGTLVYSWPQAYEKAIAAGEIVRRRLADAGVHLERIHTEIIGVDACHGMLAAGEHANIAEVTLRIAVQDRNRAAVERFTREMAPLVLSGPPSATAYSGGKGDIKEVFAYWPALIRRTAVQPLVTFV